MKKDVQSKVLLKILKNQKNLNDKIEAISESVDLLIQIETDRLNKEKGNGRK